MKFGKTTVLGALGAAFISTSAMAADVPPMVINTAPPPPPVVVVQQGFDWAGPYVGAYAGRIFWFDDGTDFTWADWLFGGQAGYNIVFGRLLAGVEFRAGVIDNFGDLAFEGGATVRAGVILGDRVLVYAEVGLGTVAFNEPFWTFGGGVEIGIGRSLSVFAEAAVRDYIGEDGLEFMILGGVNFHLGN